MPKKKKNKRKYDLKIKPFKSGRDDIKKRPLMEQNVIPSPLGAHILCGTTKSGKSCLVANMLENEDMYKDFYDIVYVVCLSPSDLLLNNCTNIKKKNVIRSDDPKVLRTILDEQEKIIEEDGFKNAPKLLFILDDAVSSNKYLNSKFLKDVFFGGSHYKVNLLICTQSYVKVPRSLRINSLSIFLFHGLCDTELERFAAEHQPPGMKKDIFINMIKNSLEQPYSFLFANCDVDNKKVKFRKGFDTILELE